ncbi:MAG TPA: hypothetical protein VGQ39_20605 [Pyrinomonadaceae bacterium]|nr:hypothetical protein [Pyrinomonadaceae bacterium]
MPSSTEVTRREKEESWKTAVAPGNRSVLSAACYIARIVREKGVKFKKGVGGSCVAGKDHVGKGVTKPYSAITRIEQVWKRWRIRNLTREVFLT